jgi:formylglycine-generating enzyme required for sulfatase activity
MSESHLRGPISGPRPHGTSPRLAVLLGVILCASAPAQDGATAEVDRRGEPLSGSSRVRTERMILVPAGEVSVGTDLPRVESLADGFVDRLPRYVAEMPRHVREVEAFSIDRTEVTNRQWATFLQATGRAPGAELVEEVWGGQVLPPAELEDHPVACVSFLDVQAYLDWSGQRLPTEGEWTRAARGSGERHDYPWGERFEKRACRCHDNADGRSGPVGEHASGASPFDVLGMAGNVAEWVDTPYVAHPGFEVPTVGLRNDARRVVAPFDSRLRVVKGGCFINGRQDVRIDGRLGLGLEENDAALGFRAARSLEPGLDAVARGWERVQAGRLGALDPRDVVALERTETGDGGALITGYSVLAFAHRKDHEKGLLQAFMRASKDEAWELGVLTTTEALTSPELPPGDYVVAYRASGRGDFEVDGDRSPRQPLVVFLDMHGSVVGQVPVAPATSARFTEASLVSDVDQGQQVRLGFSVETGAVTGKVPRFALTLELAEPWPEG